MNRNENGLTENAKTQQLENHNYNNENLYNIKQHLLFPTYEQNNQTQKMLKKNGISYTYNKNQYYINSSNSENINSFSSSKKISKTDYSPKRGYYSKIYINNYKPKNKKFKVIRNDNDILKYFSKNYKKNKINDNKDNDDSLLNDFDTTQSNKNNIIYLINPNNNNENISIKNINNYHNLKNQYKDKYYNKKISKNFLPFCIYNNVNGQSIKRIKCDLKNCPGCIYCLDFKNNKKESNSNININHNKPNIIINIDDDYNKNKNILDLYKNKKILEDSKSNDFFDEGTLGNFTPNFVNPNNINEIIPKKNTLIEEENNKKENENENEENEENENEEKEENEEEKEEKEEKEKHEEEKEQEEQEEYDTIGNDIDDIDNELTQRGNRSIHNFINRIKLPREHRIYSEEFLKNKKDKKNIFRPKRIIPGYKTKEKDEDENNNKEINDIKRKTKSLPKKFDDDSDDENNKIKFKGKSFPKTINNNGSARHKLIKTKKIKLLRE